MTKNILKLVFAFSVFVLVSCQTVPPKVNLDSLQSKKVLIILTNHSKYPTRKDTTGVWLTELTHFYDVMQSAGFDLVLASPKGGKAPLDERSIQDKYLDKEARAHLQDPEFMAKLANTKPVGKLNPSDYIAIYFAGGHGTMWDFPNNKDLKRAAEGIYNEGGYVTAVCHGPAGLLNLTAADGKPLLQGKEVTGFSNREESLAGLKDEVPFFLQDKLEETGANFKKAFFPFSSYVVVDGRLITGQNPSSAKEVAIELLKLIREGQE